MSGPNDNFPRVYGAAEAAAAGPPTATEVGLYAERIFNVKDPAFGAVGDGTTDDTAAANLAVAAAVAAGGGTVYWPPGVYRAQGINLAIGVSHLGAGQVKSIEDGASSTAVSKIVALASPTAATPIFRFPKGTGFQPLEYVYGGLDFKALMISGGLNSETPDIPAAVSSALLVGADFRTWQKQTCTFANATERITATAHGLAVDDEIQFDFAITATPPTLTSGTLYSNFTYKVASVVDPNIITIKTMAGVAIAFTDDGTGTFYIGKAITGILHVTFERCIFRNLDCAIRGSRGYDSYTFRVFNCSLSYNWIGVLGEEHPQILASEISYNHVGVTGRLLDAKFIDNAIGGNNYGIVPYGATGPWGTTFGADDTARQSSITFTTIVNNVIYKNRVCGMALGTKCTVALNEIVGDATFAESVGVRINSHYCNVSLNNIGQGATSSSFARCAIAIDGSNTHRLTTICNNTFALTGCPAIQVTDINNSIGGGVLYGTPNIGGEDWTINANTLLCSSDKLVDYRPPGSFLRQCTINDNTIRSDGTNPGTVGATGSYIDCAFYQDNICRNNVLVGALAGQFVVKANINVAVTGIFENNRHSTPSGAPLDWPAAATHTAIVRQNTGRDAADVGSVNSPFNNPREFALAANFTRTGAVVDVTGMSFATGANEGYWVQVSFLCSNDTTGSDCLLEFASTGTPFVNTQCHTQGTHYGTTGTLTTRAATAFIAGNALALNSLVVNDATGAGGIIRPVNMNFFFITTSATTLKLQFGSSANVATMYAGARMVVYRIR